MSQESYTCPCCGFLTIGGWPGSFDICHVCYWEDDPVQLLDPWYSGGANTPSLVQSQCNYVEFGAMEQRFIENVKGVLAGDLRDDSWRPVVENDRPFVRRPSELSQQEHDNLGAWYYWCRQGT